MLFIFFTLLLSIIPCPASRNIASLPNCADKSKNQGWILVNTLDGKLSALDFNDNGNELWNVETGPGPMLSSNIDRIELSNNGQWVRIIPSLTGSLYKFNGDTIEAIPISAESLLTASFRYLDDVVIAGGKEVRKYGVILNSGKLLYECSIDGCKNKTDNENFEDLILLERNTQTVRAIEPRSGQERWNFSVGQLNIKFPQASCHTDLKEKSLKFNMKAVVPEGLVYAFGASNQLLWKKQFTSPIVNVWTWDGNNFKSVDLFSDTQYSWSNNNISPSLYIGMHNKQVYIHESVVLQKYLTSNYNKEKNALMEISSVSQIPWKPYPAKSSALALIDIGPSKSQSEELDETKQIITTANSVLYASEYVNGNGFYLYTSEALDKQNNIQCENNVTIEDVPSNEDHSNIETEEDDTPVQVIIVSLWYWWKEVSLIAITTAFAVNFVLNQHIFTNITKMQADDSKSRTTEESNVSSSRETIQNIPLYIKSHSESSDKEFVSRYLNDFEPLHCLGKGGFGVVFEARNIIDECSYAVKRITLPNKLENRERVMREVKALAKLDHRNIVRYFQAWVESPPNEWIDFHDQKWKGDDQRTDGFDYSTTTKSPRVQKVDSSVVIDVSQSDNSKGYSASDLMRSEDDMYSDSFIVFQNSNTNSSSSSTQSEKSQKRSNSSTNAIVTFQSDQSETPATYQSNKMFLYIQMQLCRRESLRDWLKENTKRKHGEIKHIFEQIIAAVEYVHLKGLIHRDLKPSNIFFSIDGEVKIGDFGLVTGMEECNGDNIEIKDDKHTQAVGTQLYMSPEQLKGLSYNYKVDIYSLGVILFELLVPFHTSMERIITLSDLRKNRFPEKFCQDFEHEYQLLVMMLSDRPENRPTTYGIKARPPLGNITDNCDYHFEMPPRQ